MRTSKVDPTEAVTRSRVRTLAVSVACAILTAGAYRMTHDILRVRDEGGDASIALSQDEHRSTAERLDGAVLMTNEVYKRIRALQQLRAQGGEIGQHASNLLADIAAEASK